MTLKNIENKKGVYIIQICHGKNRKNTDGRP